MSRTRDQTFSLLFYFAADILSVTKKFQIFFFAVYTIQPLMLRADNPFNCLQLSFWTRLIVDILNNLTRTNVSQGPQQAPNLFLYVCKENGRVFNSKGSSRVPPYLFSAFPSVSGTYIRVIVLCPKGFWGPARETLVTKALLGFNLKQEHGFILQHWWNQFKLSEEWQEFGTLWTGHQKKEGRETLS